MRNLILSNAIALGLGGFALAALVSSASAGGANGLLSMSLATNRAPALAAAQPKPTGGLAGLKGGKITGQTSSGLMTLNKSMLSLQDRNSVLKQ